MVVSASHEPFQGTSTLSGNDGTENNTADFSALVMLSLFSVFSKPAMDTSVSSNTTMACNIRDQIISIFVFLQSTERHLCSWNVLLGIFEVFKLFAGQHLLLPGKQVMKSHQSILLPFNALLFVGVCIGKAFDLTSLPPKETMQTGTDLVLSFLGCVALFATCLCERENHPQQTCYSSEPTLNKLAPFFASPEMTVLLV